MRYKGSISDPLDLVTKQWTETTIDNEIAGQVTDMTGATAQAAGEHGLVPAPTIADATKFLKGDGTWGTGSTLPDVTGHSGKYLTNDGTNASWGDVDISAGIAVHNADLTAHPDIRADITTACNIVEANAKDYTDEKVIQMTGFMDFKGTVGVGGTISVLPSPTAANKGYTYKVITDGTYQSIDAKVGDLFISSGMNWNLIPCAERHTGTVTQVTGGTGLTGGTITSSGTLAVDTSVIATQANITTVNTAISNLTTTVNNLTTTVNGKLPYTGGTMTGKLYAQSNTDYATAQVHNIIISTSDPTGGSNGDIWIKYTE